MDLQMDSSKLILKIGMYQTKWKSGKKGRLNNRHQKENNEIWRGEEKKEKRENKEKCVCPPPPRPSPKTPIPRKCTDGSTKEQCRDLIHALGYWKRGDKEYMIGTHALIKRDSLTKLNWAVFHSLCRF